MNWKFWKKKKEAPSRHNYRALVEIAMKGFCQKWHEEGIPMEFKIAEAEEGKQKSVTIFVWVQEGIRTVVISKGDIGIIVTLNDLYREIFLEMISIGAHEMYSATVNRLRHKPIGNMNEMIDHMRSLKGEIK